MQAGIFSEPVSPTGLAIAPHGRRVAMLYSRGGLEYLSFFDSQGPGAIEEIALAGGRPGGLVWSPDGSMLAFYGPSSQAAMCQDVYVLRVRSNEARSLTADLRGHAHIPYWAPGSDRLAFASYEPPIRADCKPHLFMASLSTREIEQCTFSASGDFTPQFSPDGQALAFRRDGDIWLLDFADGVERRLSHIGTAKLGYGCFSPDGGQIVFDHGLIGDVRQIAAIDCRSGRLRPLTPGGIDARNPCWSPVSGSISYVEAGQRLVVIGPEGALRWTATLPERGILASPSLEPRWAARADPLALMDADANIWTAAPGADPRQVTFFPAKPAPVHAAERIRYPGHGGALVPALLFRPPGFDPAGCGAVIWVHGGPHNAADPEDPLIHALVSAGLLVLAPDYRGSTGHGPDWARLTAEQAGIVDLQDVAAGRDYLVGEGMVNGKRVGIGGYSYGGYLTLLALARYPEHWAAGASLWSIFDARRSPPVVREAARRDPARLAERSPAALLDQIRAPLLILHGAQDTQSTVEEAQAAAAVLTHRGQLCELAVFTDDGHGLSRHRAECRDLLTTFFRRHVMRLE